MTNSYHDLVKQTFKFPQDGIEVDEGNLYFIFSDSAGYMSSILFSGL